MWCLAAALRCGLYQYNQSPSRADQQTRPLQQELWRQGMASFILLTQHAALQCIHSLHIRLHIWSNEICFSEATQTNVLHQWAIGLFFSPPACVSFSVLISHNSSDGGCCTLRLYCLLLCLHFPCWGLYVYDPAALRALAVWGEGILWLKVDYLKLFRMIPDSMS